MSEHDTDWLAEPVRRVPQSYYTPEELERIREHKRKAIADAQAALRRRTGRHDGDCSRTQRASGDDRQKKLPRSGRKPVACPEAS